MLKKFLAVFCSGLSILSLTLLNYSPVFESYAHSYELYVTDNSSLAQIVMVDKEKYPFISNVKGESCKIENENFSVADFFAEMNAEIIFIEEVDGIVSYYGYGKDIKHSKMVNGKRVNLHVAVNGKQVTLGSPIIYGSF